MKTDTELRMHGLRALVDAMGTIEAERFITLILREPFDYTKWQRQLWPHETLEQLSQAAMDLRRRSSGDGRNTDP